MAQQGSLKAVLKAAMERLAAGDCVAAKEHGEAACRRDSASYEARLILGKACFKLGEHAEAIAAYNKAAEISPEQPRAYQGLLEVHGAQEDNPGVAQVLDKLLPMMRGSNEAKYAEFGRQKVAVCRTLGRVEEAAGIAEQLLELEHPPGARVELLAALADGLILNPPRDGPAKLPSVLEEICALQPAATPATVKYHEARLMVLMQARHGSKEAASAANQAIMSLITGRHCASPLPFICALLMADEAAVIVRDEELPASLISAPGARLVRSRLVLHFPTHPAARAAWALALLDEEKKE